MYLPSSVIYDDMTELEWLNEIDSTYELTGGQLYQANKHENGNYVFKYLGGVSIMQSPFFLIGHAIALNSNYKANGFSPPYQYSIAFGALFYCIFAIFLLRNILLRYYSDHAVALSILLMVLATNLIQYISIDSAQSHAFIFPLYVIVLYATIKWHESPKFKWAAIIGVTIGIATISRPTEAIMLFIPLLWETHTKEARAVKWKLVKKYRWHVLTAILFGIIGIAPQLIYWKMTTGSFIYNVGSKWFFFTPWFRVLFGFTNGWFIYTPITILFIIGMLYIKKFPFKKSVIVFCLLNIWIVIAWSDWQYGATYSTRALVQSYPIFALPFAAVIERLLTTKWKYLFFGVASYLVFVNWFQIGQYNETVLHYRDMNAKYYSHIYLNSSPTPLDMSLLDTEDFINDESDYNKKLIYKSTLTPNLEGGWGNIKAFGRTNITASKDNWIRIDAKIKMEEGFSSSYINCKIESKKGSHDSRIRLFSPISNTGQTNEYSFYVDLSENIGYTEISLSIFSEWLYRGTIESWAISQLVPKAE